jgi:hypothetical protein
MATIPQIIALGRVTALALIAGCTFACGPKFEFGGHWKGMRTMKGVPGAASYVVSTANALKLYVHPDGQFDLQDMGLPKQGEISIQGMKAVLIVKKIAGKDIAFQPNETKESSSSIELTGTKKGTIIYSDPKAMDPAPVELTRSATDDTGRP